VRETFLESPGSNQASRFRLLTSALSMVVAVVVAIACGVKILDYVAGEGLADQRSFTYFASLVAIISVVVLSISALMGTRGTRDSPRVASARAALALYGAAVFLTHTTLFSITPIVVSSPLEAQTWPDTIIEFVLPGYLVAEWVLNPLRARISRSAPFIALLFPASWVIVGTILGQMTGWWVNPALDFWGAENILVPIAYLAAVTVSLFVIALLLLMVNRIHYRLFPKNLFES
jgi:hypothetical protein